MPSSATITSFITMVAGSKARASHINLNFSNYRGHILPTDPNTATSAHQLYDLGAPDAQWRRIYLKEAPFINGTQSGKLEIENVYDGSNPADLIDDAGYALPRIAFNKDTNSSITFNFVVPDAYAATNRISLNIKGHCQTGGSHFTMQTESTLYRPGTTDGTLTTPSNVLTSTSNINPPTTTGIVFTDTSLRLSNSGGTINSVTIAAGDILGVRLTRTGNATADTNTGYFYLASLIIDLNN